MKRAVLYTRVSKASKSLHGDVLAFDQRPELQEDPLLRLAQQRGWPVAKVYCDRMSGAKENRPALAELLADARHGAFEVVLVWRFDRLSRSVQHFLSVVGELRDCGVDLISHEQGLDTTTAMGKFSLTMFAALAELEREVIRERVCAGLDFAREHGTKSGRPIGRPQIIFRRDLVPELRAKGLSWAKIARQTGGSVRTIRRVHQAAAGALVALAKPTQSDSEEHHDDKANPSVG